MPLTKDNLHDVISYHKADDSQRERIEAVRVAAENMIATILEACPGCADQSAAIRHVREGMMTANAAIVLKGAV